MQLQAGTYYIGNPEIIEEKIDGLGWRGRVEGVPETTWRTRVLHNVKGADREAAIQFDHYLAVIPLTNLANIDAGEIALNMLSGELTPDMGYMFETFSTPFDCRIVDGKFRIGHLTIDTKENRRP